MRVQVLSIGQIEEGDRQGTNAGKWHRRTFQVFEPSAQVAGNIQVYAPKEQLEAFNKPGIYEAETRIQPGNRGRLEVVITGLQAVEK